MSLNAKVHIEEKAELCSIIMPTYNSEKYIAKAIDSVLNQSCTNWELIIINDCSTDNTEQIIKNYQQQDILNKKIKLINLLQNKGVANARNIGIQNAKGRYIAFLDADDIWQKEKLYKQIQLIESTNADITYTAYMMIDDTGKKIKERKIKETLQIKDLLKENSIIFSSIVCKKESIIKKHFKSEWYHEDYVFLLDLAKASKMFRGLNENLMQYRVHKSGRSFNKQIAAEYRWKIYRDYLKMNFLKSCYYFIVYAFNGIRKYK